MNYTKVLRLFGVVVLFFSGAETGFLNDIGRGAAKEVSGGLQSTAKILSDSLLQASYRLEEAMRIGSEAVRETVAQLMVPITELVHNIEFRINSGDLAHVGADASANVKDALIQLSKNWNMAINSADLEMVGAEAAKLLSDAIQNMNLRVEVAFSIDENTKDAIGYMAMAGGFGFTVLCIGILLCIKSCRSCCRNCCVKSVEGFEDLFFQSGDDEFGNEDEESDVEKGEGQNGKGMFLKLNNLERNVKVNNLI